MTRNGPLHGVVTYPLRGGRHLGLSFAAAIDLTGDLEGCQALEVVASASLAGGGRHALVHALALNTFDPAPRSRGLFGLFGLLEWLFPRRTISLRQAYFGQRCDRLALRWSSQWAKLCTPASMMASACSTAAWRFSLAVCTRVERSSTVYR